MKYLRLYESDKNSSILDELFSKEQNYKEKRDIYFDAESKIIDLIENYIELNDEYFKKTYKFDIYSFNIEHIVNMHDFIKIEYEEYNFTLKNKDYVDLLRYLEDPKSYKKSKKYNL
jgi:hypothetical protein